ncbi:MAG TPA: DinB family protein [Dongiaceae bacterium]|nr:DinB family protein [Dongiaceae bacterium]
MPVMPSKIVMPGRPQPSEYAPYYEKYISLVTATDIVSALEAQRLLTSQLLGARSEREGNFRYAPGKWTVKEVVGHMNDAERVFSYRALRIARGDKTPLPGFEQDDYVKTAGSNERSLADLAEEFVMIRNASIALFRAFSADAWIQTGTASGNPITARALAYIVAGHELHHRRILEEKYLPAIPRA